MNSTSNPEPTNPNDVAVAALKEACQQIGRPDGQLWRVNEQVSKLESDSGRHSSERQKRVPPHRSSLGRLALQGLIGLLVAACIGAAAMVLLSQGDAAKQVTAQSSPSTIQASASKAATPQSAFRAPPAQTPPGSAPNAADPSPEQEQLVALLRSFLAVVEQDIEELKTSIKELKTSIEQLKTSQGQMVDSEQQLRPKTSAPPPRSISTSTGKPEPKLSSPRARAQH